MESKPNGMEKAVVIGASISGLMAARALVDHFGQVTVVERDVLPPAGQPRKGVS
jgi:glycine/D-amino acid oxidase-like deaminating enzyme